MFDRPKLTVRDIVNEFSPSTFDGSLIDLISWAKQQIATHGPQVRLSFDSKYQYQYDPSSYPMFILEVPRLESDVEYQQRVLAEQGREIDLVIRERMEYERLRQKFEQGGKPEVSKLPKLDA